MGFHGIRQVRRTIMGVGALLACLHLGSLATAQEVDISLFKPVAGPTGILGVETARVMPHWSLYAALNTHYTNDELVARRSGTLLFRPIHHRVISEIAVGASFWGRLDMHAALPIIARQLSADYPEVGESAGITGIGDLRISARGVILRNLCDNDVGLAAVLTGVAPTGGEDPFLGEASGAFIGKAVLDYCHPSGFIVALNAGFRVRQDRDIINFRVGDEVLFGLGAELPLGAYGFSLLGEVEARLGLGTDDINPDVLDEKKFPVEARGAVRWRSSWGLMVTGGVGSGLTAGYGAPDVRAFLGLGYALDMSASKEPVEEAPQPPAPVEKVTPRIPGGVPPAATPKPLDAATFDKAVSEDPDPDGDGIQGKDDKCPAEPEDFDKFEDSDGCPDLDNDRDGVPDATDKCPLDKEVVNGIKDDDGCPDEGEAKVTVTATKVEILDKVFFETGSDQLKEESEAILQQVAGVLKANWQLRRLRVEGHTDSRGDKEMNVDLSERRARRVKVFLEKAGVARHRLEAKGYGPTKPIASNRTQAGRANNRRVAFTILERTGADQAEGGAK